MRNRKLVTVAAIAIAFATAPAHGWPMLRNTQRLNNP